MIEGVIIKELTKNEDDRGYLVEVYRHDELDYQVAMSYLSWTKPGVARGPHEHTYQSDYFIFPGPGTFRLYLWDRRPLSSPCPINRKISLVKERLSHSLLPPKQ